MDSVIYSQRHQFNLDASVSPSSYLSFSGPASPALLFRRHFSPPKAMGLSVYFRYRQGFSSISPAPGDFFGPHSQRIPPPINRPSGKKRRSGPGRRPFAARQRTKADIDRSRAQRSGNRRRLVANFHIGEKPFAGSANKKFASSSRTSLFISSASSPRITRFRCGSRSPT